MAESRARTALRYVVIGVAILVFSSIVVGGHWYLVQRLILAPGLPVWLSRSLVGLTLVLGLCLVVQPLAERRWPRRLARFVAWPAACWMGVAFLLLMTSFAADLLLLLLAASFDGTLGASVTASRVRAIAIVALVLPTATLALRQGLARPRLARIEIDLERWPQAADGFRIVQISDIHIGTLVGRDFASWLVDEVSALSPDLVAITGDLVDGSVAELAKEVAPFAGLSAPKGVYFVTGNHDHYSGVDGWVDAVRGLGIRVLRNEHVVLDTGDAAFVLAGIDDYRSKHMPGEQGEDLPRALADAPDDRPVVLLSHDPAAFRKAARAGVDLQLSGHTHGGQIWPFNYFVRLATPFVAGLYRIGASVLYVSRGTGSWGPPMRLRSPAEITEITLRARAATRLTQAGSGPVGSRT